MAICCNGFFATGFLVDLSIDQYTEIRHIGLGTPRAYSFGLSDPSGSTMIWIGGLVGLGFSFWTMIGFGGSTAGAGVGDAG